MAWIGIAGPRDSTASDRERMLAIAAEAFAEAEVTDPVRVDVPGKGSGSSDDGVSLRDQITAIIPALQSGSLFGGSNGVLVMDSQNLLKAEIDTIVELLAVADPHQCTAVFAAAGTIPAALKKAIAAGGEVRTIGSLNARDVAAWIADYAKEHGLRIDGAARDELVKTFGADTAAMRRAIDQLAVTGGVIGAEAIAANFDNRPDEPMWFFGDAVMAGDHQQALRRLSDFLQHNHPLILLSYLEGEVRKRSLAAISTDFEDFVAKANANPGSWATKKIWERRTRANGQALANCVRALAKADLTLKTQPEATHRVTMERLTVAMALWMGR